jgi:signal peptidase I
MVKMEKYKPNFSTCIGPSMFPTIKNGDALITKDIHSKAELQVGDIVIYPAPETMLNIVHRIIKKTDKHIITRGDNNNHPDKYPINYTDITGIVTGIKRGSKIIKISGGSQGILRHRMMLLRKYTMPYLLFLPQLTVTCITSLRLLYFLHHFMTIKIIRIERNNKTTELMHYKNRVIGKRSASNEPWQIDFPYKLFINQEKLS